MKDKIRPIYSELQGILSQIPEHDGLLHEQAVWEHYNNLIDELMKVSERQDFSRFKVQPQVQHYRNRSDIYIQALDLKTKVGGLIARLRGEYFADETPSAMPSTVINQTQVQKQEQQQSVAVGIAMLIAENKPSFKEGTPERTFLDKCGEMLKKASDAKEIIGNIISLASATGVGIEFLKKIFGV